MLFSIVNRYVSAYVLCKENKLNRLRRMLSISKFNQGPVVIQTLV
jgi:hypothetical protein